MRAKSFIMRAKSFLCYVLVLKIYSALVPEHHLLPDEVRGCTYRLSRMGLPMGHSGRRRRLPSTDSMLEVGAGP